MGEYFPLLLFAVTVGVLLLGYPVAFSLSGTALLFAALGTWSGDFDGAFLSALPERIFGIMGNETLLAIPLFVFMGVMLERAQIAEELLETMARALGRVPGGLGLSVCLVGGLLAASTGIVGATVVTMGLISLPSMLKRNYSPALATGVICASGTLGQIIPPSIVLVILGDVVGSAHQQAQLAMGNFSPASISVGDLFVGAIIPGAILLVLYMVYVLVVALVRPHWAPAVPPLSGKKAGVGQILRVLFPPLFLMVGVLGSILSGIATPTEAASVGSVGALCLAFWGKKLNRTVLREALTTTAEINTMVFTILLGASVFSLVFRGFGGDDLVRHHLENMGGGVAGAFFLVMAVMFFLGFFLDFFEITFVMVPVVGPVLLSMGLDPIWLGVMIAINLQTSFLTPPFGFSLFYLRGVAPAQVSTWQIYGGVVPFILIQLLVLGLLWFWPGLATWLPGIWNGVS